MGNQLNQREINRMGYLMEQTLSRVAQHTLSFYKSNYVKLANGGTVPNASPDGNVSGTIKWKDLSPTTIARKRKSGSSNADRILIDTGKLLSSIKIINFNRDVILLGTNVSYGRFHQQAVPNKNPQLPPRRPFFYNSKELNKDNLKIINKEILKLFKIV